MRFLCFCAFLFCAVSWAAEDECVLTGGASVSTAMLRKIKGVMGDKKSLWVMIMREGQMYTASYDMRGETHRWSWLDSRGLSFMIMPVIEYLQNEAMRGYKRCSLWREAPGGFSSELTEIGSSLNPRLYDRCAFSSLCFRLLLLYSCPRLHDRNKVQRDAFGRFMTKDVLRSLTPGDDEVLQFFLLLEMEEFVNAVSDAKQSGVTKVFMPIPNVGVVVGGVVPKADNLRSDKVVSRDSFLYHKMDEVLSAMMKKYPYTRKAWTCCLNYEEGLLIEKGQLV